MCIGCVEGDVLGVGVYRIYEDTANLLHMYVDDLVTTEGSRSTGVGKALLLHMEKIAREKNCNRFNLDSGAQRFGAHKFYFREGMHISAYHFVKELKL